MCDQNRLFDEKLSIILFKQIWKKNYVQRILKQEIVFYLLLCFQRKTLSLNDKIKKELEVDFITVGGLAFAKEIVDISYDAICQQPFLRSKSFSKVCQIAIHTSDFLRNRTQLRSTVSHFSISWCTKFVNRLCK